MILVIVLRLKNLHLTQKPKVDIILNNVEKAL